MISFDFDCWKIVWRATQESRQPGRSWDTRPEHIPRAGKACVVEEMSALYQSFTLWTFTVHVMAHRMTSTRPNCSPRPDVDPLESHGRPGSYCHPGSDARPDFQKLYDQPVYLIYIDVIREPGWHCCFRLVQWTDRQEGRRQYSSSYGCRVICSVGQIVPGSGSSGTDSSRSETDELRFCFSCSTLADF